MQRRAEVLIGEQLNPCWEGTGSGNAEFADATTTRIISYSTECYRAAKLFHGEFYSFRGKMFNVYAYVSGKKEISII